MGHPVSAPGSRRLAPKAMDSLLGLARHSGDVVECGTLRQEVWQGRSLPQFFAKIPSESVHQVPDYVRQGAYPALG